MRRTTRYPFAKFHNVPVAAEAGFVERVRLYARAITFLYATEFQRLTGDTAADRESNRFSWLRRTTDALDDLCRIRSSFDDWALAQPPRADIGCSPIRWACGFATLASLIVDPNVIAGYSGIQKHCGHLNAYLNGHDRHVSIYSTDTPRQRRPCVHFSVHDLSSRRQPRITSLVRSNVDLVAARHNSHILELFHVACSHEFPLASISRFRRCIAEVALAQPQAADSHALIAEALYGDHDTLTQLARSISQLIKSDG